MYFYDIHQRRDDDGSQNRDRQITDKSGKSKEKDGHGDSGGQGNDLRSATILFVHGGTGNTSVYRAASDERSRNITSGKDFLSVIQFIAVFESKIIFCKKCFCHNNNSNHQSAANCLGKSNLYEFRNKKCRKSWFDCL